MCSQFFIGFNLDYMEQYTAVVTAYSNLLKKLEENQILTTNKY